MNVKKLSLAAIVFVSGLLSSTSIDAGTLLLVNKSSDSLSFFEETSLRPLKVLPTGFAPHEVMVSASGRRAVVSNYGSYFKPGASLTVIDVPQGQVVQTISLPQECRPHGIQFLTENKVLVTAEGIQSLLLVDIEQGKLLKTLPLPGQGAHLMTLDRDKKFAYISNNGSGTVLKIDLSSEQIVASAKIGRAAEGITLSGDEEKLLVTNRKDNIVAVLKADDLSLLTVLKTGHGPIRITLFHHGQSAVLTNSVSGTGQTIDLKTLARMKTFKTTREYSLGHGRVIGGLFGHLTVPITIVVRDDQQTAYIANSFAGNVTLVNLQSGEILKTFTALAEPDGMAYTRLNTLIENKSADKFYELETPELMTQKILAQKQQELCVQKIDNECADTRGFKKRMTLEAFTMIQSPPEKIWEIMMDVNHYRDWNSFMPDIRSLGAMSVGDEIEFKVRMGYWPTPFERVKIQTRVEGREMCWGSAPLGVLITQRCRQLYPLSHGQTLYYTTEKFQGPSAGLVSKLIRSALTQGIQREASELKMHAEEH